MGMTVETQSLAIGYPGHNVGAEITLDAGPADILCLLGPNGSGKTTLFKTLLGLIPSRGGQIRIRGRPLADMSRREIAREIAYVPQSHATPFAFTVSEMVVMGRTARLGALASPSARDFRVVADVLARLRIGSLGNADFTRLSGGQRQLVLIARALAQETPILIMDEPTANLDFSNQALVLREIAALAADGLTVILSTHDPNQAFAIGTRAALLHGGRLQTAGEPTRSLTAAALSEVYAVDIRVERLADGRTICLPTLGRSRM